MIGSRKRPNNVRVSKDSPFYPMSYNGYTSPARLAMAKHLDRCLGSDEYIYFNDGDCFNSDINNLQLVSHKELTKLNQIRGVLRSIDRMNTRIATLQEELITLQSNLSEIRFLNTPCDCPKCTRSRESRQAEYRL
jgi:hypothetical protein